MSTSNQNPITNLASFVGFWKKCPLDRAPYVHPEDIRILKKSPQYFDLEVRSADQFIKSKRFGDFNDRRFDLSLLPVPYGGRLATAEIVILALNPGYGLSDYVTDGDSDHANWHIKNIRQDLHNAEYPFISLNPKFCWTGGFHYWEEKLRTVLTRIAREKFGGRYLDALRFLSQRIACIELVPYKSYNFKAHRLVECLPSSRVAIEYVKNVLVPKALSGELTLIATRQVDRWRLPKRRKHIVIYGLGEVRGAPLGYKSSGGKAILEKYGISAEEN